MRATISGEALRWAKSAYHVETSKPGTPASAAVGVSGKAGERFAEAIASARSLPAAICGADEPSPSNSASTCPASRSAIAGPAPL